MIIRKIHRATLNYPNHTNRSKQTARKISYYFWNFFTLVIILPIYDYLYWFNSITLNLVFQSSIMIICIAIWWMRIFLHLFITVYRNALAQIHYYGAQLHSYAVQWINDNNIHILDQLYLMRSVLSRATPMETFTWTTLIKHPNKIVASRSCQWDYHFSQFFHLCAHISL